MKKIMIFAVMAILFISYNFVSQMKEREGAQADKNLTGIAESNAASVRQTIESYIKTLTLAADIMEGYDNPRGQDAMSILGKIARDGGFARLAINDADGTSYTSDGHVVNIKNFRDFANLKSGEVYVGDVETAIVDGASIVNIYVPLRNKNEETIASLRIVMDTENLHKTLKSIFWNEGGYFQLIDGNGRYLASDAPNRELFKNLLFANSLERMKFESASDKEKIADDFANCKVGFVKYEAQGEKRRAYYAPVGVNKWMLAMVLPESVVMEKALSGVYLATFAAGSVFLIFFAMFAYVYYSQSKMKKEAMLNEQCFRVLADQSGKIIFEWDFSDNSITAHSGFEEVFGRKPATHDSPLDAISADLIHQDDCEIFADVFKHIGMGENIDKAKFRIKNAEGNFRWCSLSGIVVRSGDGKPYKAIGTLEDIDDDEREKEHLKFRAMTDPLTGLYNKTAAGVFAQDILLASDESQLHAVICIDLDDFKGINDHFGHLFGDEVLQEISEKIKLSFRSTDILGRFGGDEFILLVKDLPSIDFVREKTESLIEAVHKTYNMHGIEHSICASIGVSIYPNDGKTYEELYKKADEASYKAKGEGKCKVIFYSEVN